MIKQLFETMNDVLDEIEHDYATAEPALKQELSQKLNALKSMSDHLIEEWLKFEERFGKIAHNLTQQPSPVFAHPELPQGSPEPGHQSEAFTKGQGYFQLMMFDHAIRSFEQVVKQYPDFMLARLYLAMGYMRSGNEMEAYRHFKFIISLTDHAPMKAISYNAMGCIQAKNENLEQAEHFFKLAYMADPSCIQPVINLEVCAKQAGLPASAPQMLH
ncbi:tetratricopeptide repeat protein [Paenibacillus sp. HJGM_3]|uniref:tetratricopeptide repeat protein n=1 Tax=Paenibacillus sp. HJGM_3 TaxID=3379816 RepID=UPI00385A3B3D